MILRDRIVYNEWTSMLGAERLKSSILSSSLFTDGLHEVISAGQPFQSHAFSSLIQECLSDHGICPAWLFEDLHWHHSGSESYVLCRMVLTQVKSPLSLQRD